MELKWERGAYYSDVDQELCIAVILINDGKWVGWIDGRARPYEVHDVMYNIADDMMPCENAEYVTLRQAMRALKETVTVLLIGRGHGA